MEKLLKLLLAIAVSQLAGVVGSAFTVSAIPTWYAMLDKPSFSPPNWLFGPVWVTLYTLMGISFFLIWQKGLGRLEVRRAALFFLIHLIFNAAWTIIFFGFQNLLLAFIEIIILWALIAILIAQFRKIYKWAAVLLIPYLIWVSFAAVLNFSLWKLNASSLGDSGNTGQITNFDECVKAGYPVLESYPAQCKTPDGEGFVQDIGNELEKQDLIRVSSPRPNQIISSPLVVEGEARGIWFFEASFPIRILDDSGNELGVSFAQAQDEWMTEEFVPFRGEIEFSKPLTLHGRIIFEKDNPSGLPEHQDALYMPITF